MIADETEPAYEIATAENPTISVEEAIVDLGYVRKVAQISWRRKINNTSLSLCKEIWDKIENVDTKFRLNQDTFT